MNVNVSEQQFLETFKKRIIKDTIKIIFKNYHVLDDDDNQIEEEIVINTILKPKIIKRCIGTTKSSPVSQCNRYAIEGYDYCKSHIYNMCLQKKNEERVILPEMISNKESIIDKNDLMKIFIDDSFYYKDDKYIYNTNSMTKAGYLDNGKYILTSDPFVLNLIN